MDLLSLAASTLTAFQFLSAAITITAAPNDVVDDRQRCFYYQHIALLAVDWEVMDKRELVFYFQERYAFESEVSTVRTRFAELSDAPRLADVPRFPSREETIEAMSFNRQFYIYLDRQRDIYPRKYFEYSTIMYEVDVLLNIWDAARDAATDSYHVSVRRAGLKRLYEKLGPEDYYAGRMPAFVPLRWFQEIE